MGALGSICDSRSRLRIVVGLLAWTTILAGPAASRSFGPFELPVEVEESPGVVRLHVLVPEGMPVASIEVLITARNVVVLGRHDDGLPLQSRPIGLSQAVSAEGVEASFAADGSLTITLQAVTGGGS